MANQRTIYPKSNLRSRGGSSVSTLVRSLIGALLLLVLATAPATSAGEGAGGLQADQNVKGKPVVIDCWLAWDISSGMYSTGYQYEIQLRIGNPLPIPLEYDAICLQFSNPAGTPEGAVSEAIVYFTDTSVVTMYDYGFTNSSEAPNHRRDYEGAIPEVLGADQGVRYGYSISSGRLRWVDHDEAPNLMTVTLLRRGIPETKPQVCVLPPLLRLPSYGETVVEERDGFLVEMTPVWLLPSKTGISDTLILNRVFSAASAIASNAVFVSLQPRFISEIELTDGRKVSAPRTWQYVFGAGDGIFSLYADDPWKAAWGSSDAEPFSQLCDPDMLRRVVIDCDVAVLMLAVAGEVPEGYLRLERVSIGGQWELAWVEAARPGHQRVGVLASLPRIIRYESLSGSFVEDRHCIWNDR